MQALVLTLVGICLVATILPLVTTHHWWIRIFDFPRAQITSLAIFTLVMVLVVFHGSNLVFILLLLTIGVLVYQSIKMIRYTPFYPHKSPENAVPRTSRSFRTLLFNVRMDNQQYDKCLELIETSKPHLILLTEVDDKWVEALKTLDNLYPYYLKYPLDNTFGILFYSKYELESPAINFLVSEEIPSVFARVRLSSGAFFDFYGLHPEAPRPGTSTYERDTELLVVGKMVSEKGGAAIVAGDLNDVAWSRTSELFQKRTALWDPREGRGFFNTYNAHYPFFRYPLDHFFYTNNFNLVKLKKLPNHGSDHFPLVIELEYEARSGAEKTI